LNRSSPCSYNNRHGPSSSLEIKKCQKGATQKVHHHHSRDDNVAERSHTGRELYHVHVVGPSSPGQDKGGMTGKNSRDRARSTAPSLQRRSKTAIPGTFQKEYDGPAVATFPSTGKGRGKSRRKRENLRTDEERYHGTGCRPTEKETPDLQRGMPATPSQKTQLD